MTPSGSVEQLRATFNAGNAAEVLRELTSWPTQEHTPESLGLLGRVYWLTGRYAQAEGPLLQSAARDYSRAGLDYGQLLRVQGPDAAAYYEDLLLTLPPQQAILARALLGSCQFETAQEIGLSVMRSARISALTDPDFPETDLIRIGHEIARCLAKRGEYQKAQMLFDENLAKVSPHHDLVLYQQLLYSACLTAFCRADRAQSQKYIDAFRLHAHPGGEELLSTAGLKTIETELYLAAGQYAQAGQNLSELAGVPAIQQDRELAIWHALQRSQLHASEHQYKKALVHLVETATHFPSHRLELEQAKMYLFDSQFERAKGLLHKLLDSETVGAMTQQRAELYLAAVCLRQGELPTRVQEIRQTVENISQSPFIHGYEDDLAHLGDVMKYGLLDPDIAPDIEVIQGRLGEKQSEPPPLTDNTLYLRLQTLGQPSLHRGSDKINLSLEGGLLTLAYLALHPGQTRRELEQALYPDRQPKAAGDYFRAIFRELRQRIDPAVIVMEGPAKQPRYSIGPQVHVQLDLLDFQDALAQGSLPRMLALYQGPFLADLRLPSAWADQMRTQLQTELTAFLRQKLDDIQATGDKRRALLYVNEYLRILPDDLGMLERRIEVGRDIVSTQDFVRYQAELLQQQAKRAEIEVAS